MDSIEDEYEDIVNPEIPWLRTNRKRAKIGTQPIVNIQNANNATEQANRYPTIHEILIFEKSRNFFFLMPITSQEVNQIRRFFFHFF